MKSIQEIVIQLNAILVAARFSKKQFIDLYKLIKKEHQMKIRLIDLDKFDEDLLERAKKEKLEQIKNQNFEMAARQRELEKKCLRHIDFRDNLKVEQSSFYLEENKLYYFYLGEARNDKKIRELLNNLKEGWPNDRI